MYQKYKLTGMWVKSCVVNSLLISQSQCLLPPIKALGGAWLQARRGRSGRASGGGGAVAHTALPQPAAGGAAAQPGARDVRPSRMSACSDHACPDMSLAWRAVSSVAEHAEQVQGGGGQRRQPRRGAGGLGAPAGCPRARVRSALLSCCSVPGFLPFLEAQRASVQAGCAPWLPRATLCKRKRVPPGSLWMSAQLLRMS